MNSRPPRGSAFPARLPATGTAAAKAPSAVADRVLRPQRLLHEAAADLARQRVPAGVGLDSDQVRQRMVRRLQSQGVEHPAVLDAMGRVPRHRFVDSALVTQAYEDTSLPIGLGQTISKPIVVGRMLQLLATRPGAPAERPLGHVLEIGTGCGYQAALLALLARRVVSIERLRPLHERARAHLDATGARDIRLVWGDGRLGHAPLAPYDTIVAAAGGEELPQAWMDQLAPGGRLVAPMHSPDHGGQVLVVVEREGTGWRRSLHGGVHFVPLAQGVA
jgi:protein-L-isoaspartate(D-aspartate) O-methyltransferase